MSGTKKGRGMELDTIVCGDCLDVMAEMPDGCVDFVVADFTFWNYGQSLGYTNTIGFSLATFETDNQAHFSNCYIWFSTIHKRTRDEQFGMVQI